MQINDFLNLNEQEQKEHIIKLDNESFNSFIQEIKKKNLKLSMLLSSYRQSNKNINKKIEEDKKSIENKIELYKIKDNPEQPRKIFTEEQVNEKIESIRSRGLITPITILKKDEEYFLIAGQLRLEAYKRLNQEERLNNISTENMLYSKIDVFIKENEQYSNNDIAIDSLVENLNRADMNVVDTALAIKKIMVNQKITVEELGLMIGKSKFYVSSYISIANADVEFLDYVVKKGLTQPTIIYLILQLNKTLDEKKKLIDRYIEGNLKKTQLQDMKNEQNDSKSETTKRNTEKKIYEEVFSFKKQFNVKKYENLDVENKNMIEQKLLMIKDIQQEISKILEK
ncbi:MAG: ParB/RepB/Spo0J family partition protein [Leptotrichiaceae bacterium]|nr:ParB/RepB/Spo0J family partition protein [Leptotrichiaceae bacterium]